jgi:hypothetical protein
MSTWLGREVPSSFKILSAIQNQHEIFDMLPVIPLAAFLSYISKRLTILNNYEWRNSSLLHDASIKGEK